MAITQGSRLDVTEGVRARRSCARVHSGETCSTHRSGILVTWNSSSIRISVLVDLRITPADHPSLDGGVERFADEIKAEPRYFGRPDGTGPKPFPSLDRAGVLARVRLPVRGPPRGTRRGSRPCRRRTGRSSWSSSPLPGGEESGSRSHARWSNVPGSDGCTRLVLRSSRRSRAAVALAESMGFVVVDVGRGPDRSDPRSRPGGLTPANRSPTTLRVHRDSYSTRARSTDRQG